MDDAPAWLGVGRAGGDRNRRLGIVREGLALQRGIASEVARPHFLCMLVEALGKADKPREGLTAVAEALSIADRTGNHYYDAEVYRLKGEMLLRETGGNAAAAEACFRRSIEISRCQNAKSLELRAVVS
jgi:predicted ATPase